MSVPPGTAAAGDSLAVRSQCDPVADLGVSGSALGIMSPTGRASLASALPASDACRAPSPAGNPVGADGVIGEPRGTRARDRRGRRRRCGTAARSGRTRWSGRSWNPVGRWPWLPPPWWTEGSGSQPIRGGSMGGAADHRRTCPVRRPTSLRSSWTRPYAPAAVIVAPDALEARGLPVPRNAILVVPPEPIPGLQPWTDHWWVPPASRSSRWRLGPRPHRWGAGPGASR